MIKKYKTYGSVKTLINKGIVRYNSILPNIIGQALFYPLGVPNSINKLLKYIGESSTYF